MTVTLAQRFAEIATAPFSYVLEQQELFLSLFPHRFDYLYAPFPTLGQSTQWQTERRYPLSDRAIQQGNALYGVRFGKTTNYCVLDIDIGSVYHPANNENAIAQILATLEQIGLVNPLACTSSNSGGLHLYFPFTQPQKSWELASAIGAILAAAGFPLKPGQLELFPNPKPYIAGTPSLFNGHRLPLQAGSYLLNSEFQPISQSRQTFTHQWTFAQNRNVLDNKTVHKILKNHKRQNYKISGRADQFLTDLNTEIAQGWTEFGQTNRLLGRIAMRCYVFHHVMHGCEPLEGEALVNEIVNVAIASPGYTSWCRHQSEIKQKAEEWARSVENSHYFPYGTANGRYKAAELSVELSAENSEPSWNERQRLTTREKIKAAIAHLLDQSDLPAQTTARFKALTQYGISGSSLYRHRDLWHPDELPVNPPIDLPINLPIDLPIDLPKEVNQQKENRTETSETIPARQQTQITSLLSLIGCNVLSDLGYSLLQYLTLGFKGCNSGDNLFYRWDSS
jgi:hypothetical protein